MTTYLPGRYRFNGATRRWMSGATPGLYVPPFGVAAAMAGGVLSSPGGGFTPPPVGDSFILGTTKPDATNTGVPAGTVLTQYNGNLIVTTAGAVYRGIKFNGSVSVRAANVQFINCWFAGPNSMPANQIGLLTFEASGAGSIATRCTIKPQFPSYFTNGIYGHGSPTIDRCDISNCVDGLDPFDGNWTITGNYIHDAAYYSPTPSTAGSGNQTHSDISQPQGGTHAYIGNNFQAFADMSISTTNGNTGIGPAPYYQVNACMMIKPDVDFLVNLTITDNWFDGGQYSLNISNRSAPSSPVRTVTNIGTILRNRFGRRQVYQGSGGDTTFTIAMPSTATGNFGEGTEQRNYYEDNGHEITIRHNN